MLDRTGSPGDLPVKRQASWEMSAQSGSSHCQKRITDMQEEREISEKLSEFIKTTRCGETLNENSAADAFIDDIFKRSYKSTHYAEKNLNKRKISSRSWAKYLKTLKNRPSVLYSTSEEKKLKRTEKFFTLDAGKGQFGSIDRYDEFGLIAYSELYSLKYDDFYISSDARFTLGKHCIQRILERNGLSKTSYDFNDLRNIIFTTIKNAPLISNIIYHFLIVAPTYNADSIASQKIITDVFSEIPIPIPTDNGLIFSSLEANEKLGKPVLALRTYFSDEMLTTQQAQMKRTLNATLSGFEDSFLIFLPVVMRAQSNDSNLAAIINFADVFTYALIKIIASQEFLEAFNLSSQKKAQISTLYRLHIRNANNNSEKYFKLLSMASDREAAQKVISGFMKSTNM